MKNEKNTSERPGSPRGLEELQKLVHLNDNMVRRITMARGHWNQSSRKTEAVK